MNGMPSENSPTAKGTAQPDRMRRATPENSKSAASPQASGNARNTYSLCPPREVIPFWTSKNPIGAT